MAEYSPRWVLIDGWAHLLANDFQGGLVARCGHPLSRGVLQHRRLPSLWVPKIPSAWYDLQLP